jgi:hypothetical protein
MQYYQLRHLLRMNVIGWFYIFIYGGVRFLPSKGIYYVDSFWVGVGVRSPELEFSSLSWNCSVGLEEERGP